MNGTRLSAVLGETVIGYIEVEPLTKENGCPAAAAGLTSATCASQQYRRRGVASWLLGQAAGWLQMAGVGRLLDYAWLEGTDPGGQDYADYRTFLPAAGFRELTRTRRGWDRTPQRA